MRPAPEVVYEMLGCLNAGDIEGFLEFVHPEAELREQYLAPDTAVYHGHDGYPDAESALAAAGLSAA